MFTGIVGYIIIGSLALFLSVSLYYNYKFGVLILEVQDSVESSLDILDQNYNSISEILEKPIFFDSVEVRQALKSITESRDAILYVANNLVDSVSEVGENEIREFEQE